MMKAYLFPGQGSQRTGMGQDLFARYKELADTASSILGYDIVQLCLDDPNHLLNNTAYTQPAIYVVSVMSYLEHTSREEWPQYVLGHSVGEYAALFAAGVFSFETGLKLVQERGRMMSEIEGGMAAVVGLTTQEVQTVLRDNGHYYIDIANHNSQKQVIISGKKVDIMAAGKDFERVGVQLFYPLKVSGPFHSRYMTEAATRFEKFIEQFSFQSPQIPVISNVTGKPYHGEIHRLLVKQIDSPVQWYQSISYLLENGVEQFSEIGPGDVLTKMLPFIKAAPMQINSTTAVKAPRAIIPPVDGGITAASLGSPVFKKVYNLRYAYLTGAMVHGIASRELVASMSRAGMMGYLSTGGVHSSKIASDIIYLQQELSNNSAFGVNLLNGPAENTVVDLLQQYQVRYVEASAYIDISEALVRLRLKGIRRGHDGIVISPVRIMAKLSRPEVATHFLQPPPPLLVEKLRRAGIVTDGEALLASEVLMADDICVEADSGGHTDMGVALVLLPAIIRLRDELTRHHSHHVHIGAAGGIGTPEAAAAAFVLGAAFILTGSVNQCTVEAGTSALVKDMLTGMDIQDTAYAPAGDMFETGARVQVLKKGVLFPARANKLYELYKQYNSLEEIEEKTLRQLTGQFFKCSLEEIYEDCRAYYSPEAFAAALDNPKQMMAYIFRWYFAYSGRVAEQGDEPHKMNFQIHCGPALGAFNQWVKGTPLQDWRNRHADDIALRIMHGAAAVLNKRFQQFSGH